MKRKHIRQIVAKGVVQNLKVGKRPSIRYGTSSMIPPSESWSVLLLASSLEHSKSHISRNPTWYSGGKVSIGGGSWTPPGAMRLVSTSQLSNALNCTGSKSKKIRPSRSFGRTLSQRPLNNWDKREPSMAVKVSRLVTKLVSPPTFSLSGECFAKLCPS